MNRSRAMPVNGSRSPFGKRALRAEIVGRKAGRSGLIASSLMAIIGVGFGAGAAYIGGRGNQVDARYSGFERLATIAIEPESTLRSGPIVAVEQAAGAVDQSAFGLREGEWRASIVEEILSEDADAEATGKTHLTVPAPAIADEDGPYIAIIFDDMGLDQDAFEQLLNLPGPVTFSFLPYANHTVALAERAKARGDSVMLHLPMEPLGAQDPGPHALRSTMTAQQFAKNLDWNLSRFDGYSGVNNHMGSKLTADLAQMKKVLAALKERNVYFVDSVTTSDTVSAKAAAATGARFITRDVFLDPEAGVQTVRRQLAQVEQIARRTGYAIAIAHPRDDTIKVIGPWLTSATTRGFSLTTMDALMEKLGAQNTENSATAIRG